MAGRPGSAPRRAASGGSVCGLGAGRTMQRSEPAPPLAVAVCARSSPGEDAEGRGEALTEPTRHDIGVIGASAGGVEALSTIAAYLRPIWPRRFSSCSTTRFFAGAGRDSGGYGIGLSLSARAVDVCGGSFRVRSDESGTVVRIRMPLAHAPVR